jgi:hypothetical protein
MTDESTGNLDWLQGPPEHDQIRFYLDSGDGVVFTEEQREALEQFMQSLITDEVSAHGTPMCPWDFSCSNYSTCGPKSLCGAKPICNPQSCNITGVML